MRHQKLGKKPTWSCCLIILNFWTRSKRRSCFWTDSNLSSRRGGYADRLIQVLLLFWWGMFWSRCFNLSKSKLLPMKLKRIKFEKGKFAFWQFWSSSSENFLLANRKSCYFTDSSPTEEHFPALCLDEKSSGADASSYPEENFSYRGKWECFQKLGNEKFSS